MGVANNLFIDSCNANGTAAGQLPPHPNPLPATGERIKVRGVDVRGMWCITYASFNNGRADSQRGLTPRPKALTMRGPESRPLSQELKAKLQLLSFLCAPGMARDLEVQVLWGPW